MNPADIVVTGLGCLGPFGIGPAALRLALAAGEPLHREIDLSAGYHRANAARRFAGCPSLDLTPWLSEEAARRMSDLSQFAVAAARMALADAGLAEVPPERTGVFVATAFGPGGFTERLALQVLQKGPRFASPFLFTDCVANAAAGQIAIATQARGPNVTICQREAGPLLAVGEAAAAIRRGEVDVCIAGAVDEMKPLSHAILDRFRALARPGRHDELPRPFDRDRNGYLAGEGAALWVLERRDRALARGAQARCRVGACVRAFDPTASRVGHGRSGRELAATLRERLGGATGGALTEVATVLSSASGARRGDALEAEVLRSALPHAPRVLVPKAVVGEFGGGPLAAALLAFAGAEFAVPTACRHPDPQLGVSLRPGPAAAGRMLCSALAAGGVSAWLQLDPP